jgi:hypothetical protein
VLVELSDPGPLLVGMKVDVYFHNEVATQQRAAASRESLR